MHPALPGGQLRLFGHDEPAFDATFGRASRVTLDRGAWVEVVPGWLAGDATLFEWLRSHVAWRAESRRMYERDVDVPRLHAVLDGTPGATTGGRARLHPILERMRHALDARYGSAFVRTSVALYRDGRDSVAWHGDYPARKMEDDTLVATVSLGAPRTFLMRPAGGGPSRAWALGSGDLVVMGGSAQRTWEHAIPKVAQAGPRIAVMYRPVWTLSSSGGMTRNWRSRAQGLVACVAQGSCGMTQPYPHTPNDPGQPVPPPVHEPKPQRIHEPIPAEPIHPELPEPPAPSPEPVVWPREPHEPQ